MSIPDSRVDRIVYFNMFVETLLEKNEYGEALYQLRKCHGLKAGLFTSEQCWYICISFV